VISPKDLAVLGILAHPVGELVDVATGLENLVRGQDSAVDLEHILLKNEVLPPQVDDVGLQGAAGRAIVVEARNAAVDLEGGGIEETAAEHGLKGGLVQGLTLQGGSRRGHFRRRGLFRDVDDEFALRDGG